MESAFLSAACCMLRPGTKAVEVITSAGLLLNILGNTTTSLEYFPGIALTDELFPEETRYALQANDRDPTIWQQSGGSLLCSTTCKGGSNAESLYVYTKSIAQGARADALAHSLTYLPIYLCLYVEDESMQRVVTESNLKYAI